MFHIHKWSKWVLYTQPMKQTYRGQVLNGIREFQQRQCTVCGLLKEREL